MTDSKAREEEIAKYVWLYAGRRKKRDGSSQKYGMFPAWRAALLVGYYAKLAFRGTKQVLDVGCGRGESITIGEAAGIEMTGAEVVPQLCEARGVTLVPGAHDMPFARLAFDALTCLDVMEHILEQDVDSCFLEFYRVASESLIGISLRESAWKRYTLHVTVRPVEWWLERLRAIFDRVEFYPTPADTEADYLVVLCA